MSTPVGHAALGLLLFRGLRPGPVRGRWRWYLFLGGVPLLPDFDFLPGLLIGDANRFHQQASHSLGAALLCGLVVALFARPLSRDWVRLGLIGVALYASHFLLDFFVHDGRAPVGQPLFWPLSSEHFHSPWTPLYGIRHGVPGQELAQVLREITSWANIWAVVREMVFLLPVYTAVWLFARRASMRCRWRARVQRGAPPVHRR